MKQLQVNTEMEKWEATKKAEQAILSATLEQERIKFVNSLAEREQIMLAKLQQKQDDLQKVGENLKVAHHELEQEKAKSEAIFKANQDELEQEKKNMAKFLPLQKGPLKLNIGGTIFFTTVSNLVKFPSMFQAMFSGRYELEKDSDGGVFIDRDGEYENIW